MCEAAKNIVLTRSLWNRIGYDQKQPTELFCDNQGVLQLVSNPKFHQHIDDITTFATNKLMQMKS